MSKEQVLEQIRALSKEEREDLIEEILLMNEDLTPEEHEKLWAEEAVRRYEELKSGKVKSIPYEEVLRDVKSRLE